MNDGSYTPNDTQKRMIRLALEKALAAYKSGDIAEGDRCMNKARTFAAPVGACLVEHLN